MAASEPVPMFSAVECDERSAAAAPAMLAFGVSSPFPCRRPWAEGIPVGGARGDRVGRGGVGARACVFDDRGRRAIGGGADFPVVESSATVTSSKV